MNAVGGVAGAIGGIAGKAKQEIVQPQIIEKPVQVFIPVKEKLTPAYSITFVATGFAMGVFVGMLLCPNR